jgi:hypothetical protein
MRHDEARFPGARARHRTTTLMLLGALSLLAPASRQARAQSPIDTAAARQLFREGSRLSQEGKWEQARDRFTQSLQLRQAAITLYSLGVTQKETGQLVEALESLRAFLHWPPDEATDLYRPIARGLINELEKRVGRVTIGLVPASATIDRLEIDGVKVGQVALDVPRLVNPGRHEVLAIATDRRQGRAVFAIGEGGEQSIKIELGPGQAAPPPSSEAVSSASSVPPAPPPPASPASTASIVLLAGGGVSLAAGVVVGLLGVSQARGAPSRQSPEVDAARNKARIGDVLGGLGLLATGVGGYLWLRGDSSSPAGAVGLWMSPGAAGLGGHF